MKSLSFTLVAGLAALVALAVAVPIDQALQKEKATETLHLLFETLEKESLDVELPVSGVIPSYVSGSIYRNGFGAYEGNTNEGGDWQFKYLFDSMAQIIKFEIEDGKVLYSNKMVKSEYFDLSKSRIPPYRTFGGTDPCMTAFGKAQTMFSATSDNLNVNVIPHGDRMIAISDMAGSMEIDKNTLETLGIYEWGEDDAAQQLFDIMTTAHPSALTQTSDVFSYVAQVFGNAPDFEAVHKYKVLRYNPTTQSHPITRETVLEIPTDLIPYMHSFAHTPNYLVFMEFPLYFNVTRIVTNVEIFEAMDWLPERQTRILVIDLNSFEIVQTYFVDPIFSYHVVNAFETEEGDIVMDYCTYPDNEHMEGFRLHTLRNASYHIPSGDYHRFHIPLMTGGPVRMERLANVSFDLPIINPAFKGKQYRYAYGTGNEIEGVWWSNLVKVDTVTGEVKTFYRPHHWPSEPVFVADPNGTEEDDGTLLSLVLDGQTKTSYLLALDAKTFEPIAQAFSDVRVPYSSHGFFEPSN